MMEVSLISLTLRDKNIRIGRGQGGSIMNGEQSIALVNDCQWNEDKKLAREH